MSYSLLKDNPEGKIKFTTNKHMKCHKIKYYIPKPSVENSDEEGTYSDMSILVTTQNMKGDGGKEERAPQKNNSQIRERVQMIRWQN